MTDKNNKLFMLITDYAIQAFWSITILILLGILLMSLYQAYVKLPYVFMSYIIVSALLSIGIYIAANYKAGVLNSELFTSERDKYGRRQFYVDKKDEDISLIGVFVPPISYAISASIMLYSVHIYYISYNTIPKNPLEFLWLFTNTLIVFSFLCLAIVLLAFSLDNFIQVRKYIKKNESS